MTVAGGGETEATLWGYCAAGVLVLPLLVVRWRKVISMPKISMLGILVCAICLAMYSESLARGQVARVLLLFYLTPVWSMIFARILLGEPISMLRGVAIILGLCGAAALLGLDSDSGVPLPRDGAEWMGLAGGVLWGLTATLFNLSERKTPAGASETQILVPLLVLLPCVIFLATLIPGGASDAVAFAAPEESVLYWAVAFAAVWIIPVLWLTLFAARRIDPTRVGIFLLLDVVVGASSASFLAGEPFGVPEATGAVLIVSAAMLEAWGHRGEQQPQ